MPERCETCGQELGEGPHICRPAEAELRATKTETPVSLAREARRDPSRAKRVTAPVVVAEGEAQAVAALEPAPSDDGFDPLIGTLLGGQYRIIERLGAGGMGTVYLVIHVALKKKFAAKILNTDTAQRPDALARFQQEAVAASKLDHDHIVNIVNFGTSEDGTVYLIMEFLRGEALNQVLSKGRLSLEDTVRIAVPVCRGLGAAHAAGIVHRDLKPENIYVSRRSGGRHLVKLLDFGISKIKEPRLAAKRLTHTGDVLGSPLYMSPEACRGDDNVDSRADIYSIGVMLFEMCTGDVPFTAENYLQILHKHITEPPPAPREKAPDLPETLESVILKALAKAPEDRYQTCEELEAALVAAVPDVDLEAPITAASPLATVSLDIPLPRATPVLTPRPPERSASASGIKRAAGSGPRPGSTSGARAGTSSGPKTALATGARPGIPPTRRKGSRAAIIAGFISTLGVLGFVAVLVLRGRGTETVEPVAFATTPTAAPAPAPAAKPVASQPAPRRAELTITSTPSGASVLLDGKVVGETPMTTWVEPDAQEHELRVELSGFKPDVRAVVLDRSRAVEIALRKVPRKDPTPRGDLGIKEGR